MSGGSKMRDPGKKVDCFLLSRSLSGQDDANKSSNIGKNTTTNQCKKVPDLWRPGSVEIKRYYSLLFYFLSSLLPICVFMKLDSVLVHKHKKKNLANIQRSWPHAGSTNNPYKKYIKSTWEYYSIHGLVLRSMRFGQYLGSICALGQLHWLSHSYVVQEIEISQWKYRMFFRN